MIDKNKIFNLFNSEGEMPPNTNIKSMILDEPFTKLIVNHQVFHQKLEKFLKAESPNYSIEDTKSASEYTVYNRAYHYIKKIDLEDRNHLEAIMDFKKEELIDSLNRAISYFETEEAYEKCAFLMKVKVFKKDIENSVPL